MTGTETVFFWACVWLYLAAGILYLYCTIFAKNNRAGHILAACALLAQTVAIASRWAATSHPPVMRDYENCLVGTWLLAGTFLVFLRRKTAVEPAASVVMLISVLLLGYGYMKGVELEPLSPAHRSIWLMLHVFTAWLSFGAFALAFAAGIVYLVRTRGQASSPGAAQSERLIYRLVLFGASVELVMMASGSIWASRLWGSYWSWDPVETWSLVSWVIYAAILHLRFSFGWRDRKFAWSAVLAFAGVITAWFGVNYIGAGSHLLSAL